MKSPLQNAEDKKFLWYHLSLPHTRPRGIDKIRKLYRAFPSSPTKGSAKPLRKEFYTAVLLPCTDRQLSEKTDGCILIFILAFCVYIFSHSTTFAFSSQCEIRKNCKKIRRICNKPPGGVSVSGVFANAPSKEIVGEAFRLPRDDVGIDPYDHLRGCGGGSGGSKPPPYGVVRGAVGGTGNPSPTVMSKEIVGADFPDGPLCILSQKGECNKIVASSTDFISGRRGRRPLRCCTGRGRRDGEPVPYGNVERNRRGGFGSKENR